MYVASSQSRSVGEDCRVKGRTLTITTRLLVFAPRASSNRYFDQFAWDTHLSHSPGRENRCHNRKCVGPGSFDKMMAPNIKKYKPLALEKPGRLPVEIQKECLDLMKICWFQTKREKCNNVKWILKNFWLGISAKLQSLEKCLVRNASKERHWAEFHSDHNSFFSDQK